MFLSAEGIAVSKQAKGRHSTRGRGKHTECLSFTCGLANGDAGNCRAQWG